jgi:DNA-binding response OmpR family regulator
LLNVVTEVGEMAPEPEPAGEVVRLLLVEDDPEVARMYQLKLELDGYSVELAGDGETALRMATENPPDLVFLDIRLPGMGGLDLLRALRANDATRSLPVVILSAFDEPELRAAGIQLGALEYLIKSQTTPGEVSSNVFGWLESPDPEG